MRRKFVQATLVLVMLSGIGAVATNSGGAIKADAAITKTVRTSKDHTGSKWYDYYYYSNGAMRSINNLAKDTYNFLRNPLQKMFLPMQISYLVRLITMTLQGSLLKLVLII